MSLPFVLRHAPSARRALALAIAAGVAVGGAVVVQAWLLAALVDGAFLRGLTLDDAVPLLAWLAGVAVLKALLQWGGDEAAVRAASGLKAGLRVRLVTRLMQRGPVGLGRERSGELTNVAVRGVDALDAYVAQYLPQTALAGLVPLLIGAVVLWVDPLSALVLFLTYPLIPLFMYLLGGAAADRTRAQWTVLARLSARFVDALQALPTLKAFGRADDEAAVIGEATARFRALTLAVLKVAFLSALVLELVATLSTAVVAVEVGLRLLYGRLPFQSALFVLMLAPEFYRPLRALGAAFHAAAAGKEASARLASLVAAPEAPGPASSEAPERTEAAVVEAAVVATGFSRSETPAVHVDDLTVTYAGAGAPAIQGVTLSVPPGETLALVGPSGAGKTTIVAALLGFVVPDRGTMTIGDRRLGTGPATSASLDAWRSLIAWVPQRPHLFSGTLADNLRLGRPGASDAELMAALERARLADLVASWPEGLQTAMGERGQRLSGGEAQRVALARAFLRDAPVVLLDEPTSSLDVATERAVAGAVADLRRGRTVLVIAHRLSTVLDADRLVVLEAGRLVEEGRPRELARAPGSRLRSMLSVHGGAG